METRSKKLKVSIVTPSFNQSSFLEDCINSVLEQDYPNIEYIIVDGGSTDGSLDIIKRYSHRLSYWVSESDQGQSHAINKGFRKASGDLIAWLNSDDIYLPDAISTAVKAFEKDPDLTVFYGNCVFVNETGCFVRYFTEVEPYSRDRLVNFSDFVMQPTTFFRREAFASVGMLDENLHYAMDWDLWCKLSEFGPFHYEPRLIAANRDYKTTKTKSGGLKRLAEIRVVSRRHKTRFWPHALISYSAAELYLQLSKDGNIVRKMLGRYLSLGIHCLSPDGILFNLKSGQRRLLYGFKPHSTIAPKGQAVIRFPVGRPVIVNILFRRAHNQETVLWINEEIVPGSKASIPFGTSDYRIQMVDLNLEHCDTNHVPVPIIIDRIWLSDFTEEHYPDQSEQILHKGGSSLSSIMQR